ncbi:DUF2946 family protein [Jeongeupia naejangsanensis]|uniref:DUF2946 domain-containing protein n=1 Tax=Jeongeupia naejangsanensis TaxID=613195 RepID=A0ABS2BNL9_9NEIS|nr:DUF2946 family protein [Jeongeupia naejangsanensis]MBM3117221.1 hypothetical protein [Jeongeupia naejangsanensis]
MSFSLNRFLRLGRVPALIALVLQLALPFVHAGAMASGAVTVALCAPGGEIRQVVIGGKDQPVKSATACPVCAIMAAQALPPPVPTFTLPLVALISVTPQLVATLWPAPARRVWAHAPRAPPSLL